MSALSNSFSDPVSGLLEVTFSRGYEGQRYDLGGGAYINVRCKIVDGSGVVLAVGVMPGAGYVYPAEYASLTLTASYPGGSAVWGVAMEEASHALGAPGYVKVFDLIATVKLFKR